MVYFGFSLNISILPVDYHIASFIQAGTMLIGIVAVASASLKKNFSGKKSMQYLFTICLVCILCAFIADIIAHKTCAFGDFKYPWVKVSVIFSILGVIWMPPLYNCLFFTISRTYPQDFTVLMFSWIVVFSSIGGSIGPFLHLLRDKVYWLPGFIIIMFLLSALVFTWIVSDDDKPRPSNRSIASNRAKKHQEIKRQQIRRVSRLSIETIVSKIKS